MGELPLIEKFIGLTQNCRREKSLVIAHRVLMLAQENGLETHEVLGNYIIPMLVECGSMHEAHELFAKLLHHNEHSWTSLIQGWVNHEDFERALYLFEQMQQDSVYFSVYTFQAVLKACTALNRPDQGKYLHAKIIEHGFENDTFISSSLVDMYAKCFSCQEARYILSIGPYWDVVAWNALLAGYTQHGKSLDALECLETLQREGICPNPVTFVCSLKACGIMGALSTGQELHAEVVKKGCERDSCVDGTLLYMYSKCGLFDEACHVLRELKIKNVVCWTTLIAGYAERGYVEKALRCLQQMQLEGTCPNSMTYSCCIKGCGNVGSIESTQNLYIEITKKGFERDPFISNNLLDVYGKQGFLLDVRNIFDAFRTPDIFSWNALISGYFQHGFAQEVLHCSNQMHAKGALMNAVTFVLSLKACCAILDLQKGQQLHIEIVKRGMEKDDCVETSLMDMYMKVGAFEVGAQMFNQQMVHDVVSWTSILSGHVEQGHGVEALECLMQMQQEGVSPSGITYVCCLKACAGLRDFATACKLHGEVIILGFDADPSFETCVLDMYIKCGALEEAQLIFKELKGRDEHAWTALVEAYQEHGCPEQVSRCFEYMELDGVCPDSGALVCMSRAQDGPGSKNWGYVVHSSIVKKGFENDIWIASALIVLYGGILSVAEAEQLLYNSSSRNVVLWTAIITAYVEHGKFEKALRCLETMQLDGVSPNGITLICSLKAAGALCAISNGQAIHVEMMRKGLEAECSVGNALVDMYAKCGYLLEAQQHLERLPGKSAVSWTALITGFACQGDSDSIFQLLERMDDQGIRLDGVFYLSVLVVCSHGGLILEGIKFFDMISRKDNSVLGFEHLSCIVDLVARAGQLENAVLLLEEMPFQPNLVVWTTILGACRKWQDVVLGRQAFESLQGLNKSKASAFLLMLDIYAKADVES